MSVRAADALFGVVFIGLAGAVVAFADASMGFGPLAVAAVLALLGGDALLAAIGNRRSLISRVGPLP